MKRKIIKLFAVLVLFFSSIGYSVAGTCFGELILCYDIGWAQTAGQQLEENCPDGYDVEVIWIDCPDHIDDLY